MAIIPTQKQNDNIDFEPVKFGKYKDRRLTPEQISIENPKYIVWAYQEYGNNFCSKALYMDSLDEVYDPDIEIEKIPNDINEINL